jgi:hypothetical protein
MINRLKMHNNSSHPNHSPNSNLLLEGLQYKDLEGILKPTIHVDEFAAKMGDDEDIIVLSFFVRDQQTAKDLASWFERGYDFILDADRSPGELKPNRYLVYVEIRRRSTAPQMINRLLEDLESLTEFDTADWIMRYKDQTAPWSEETFARMVPLTPRDYRATTDQDLNEWRVAAGLAPRKIHEVSAETKALQIAAGLK